MKRILLLLITFYPLLLFSQPAGGDGTPGNPYNGVITTPWTLSGDIYCSNLTITSGTLTINPGATLRFGSGTSLTISGTGVLMANGNISNYITFTASGTSWGHIAFSDPTSTGSSSLDYCIIESGSVSGSGYTGAGGGILIRHSYVNVSNSILRNNSSDWGGGIFVDNYRNPRIYNCQFKNNTTIHGGGGIYFWNGASSVVTNCVFDSNHCTEPSISYYSGGAITAQVNASIQVINCTFVNNTSIQPGDALLIQNSPGALIENCILWGSPNQISYASASQVVNCAIEGSSGYTSTVTLTNSGTTGPNFVATDGTNWSIQFISPCRDAGTTPSPAIPFDIIGNPRVGPYDIGAYEVQYNRWTGTINSDWFTSGNWSINVPTAHTSPVIGPSAHDPIITLQSPSLNSLSIEPSSALTVADGRTLLATNIQNRGTLTVTAGATLNVASFNNTGTFILQPTGMATVTSLTNNGIIDLNSNSSAMFSIILGSYSGTGTVNTQVYFTGGINSGGYSWHYTAVPQTISKTYLTSLIVDQNNVNLLLYDDSKITSASTPHTKEQGWQWHDGFAGTTGFSTLDGKRGYNFYRKTTDASVATYPTTSLLSDLGSVGLQYSGSTNNDNLFGWNLLGNSLTCGLNWDYVTTSARNAIYITKDNKQASYVNGLGVNGGSKFIPPLQGFFIQATDIGQSVNFSGSGVKVHTAQSYFKKSLEAGSPKNSSGTIPVVRLEIRQSDLKDETVIRIDDNATLQFDNSLDASKWLSTSEIPQLYSYFSNDMYSINAIPFPTPLTNIPLALVIPSDGTYTLNRTLIIGIDNYNVNLKDIQQNITVNLRDVDVYTFTSARGTFRDRFVLTIDNSTTGVKDIIKPDKEFNLYHFAGILNIMPLTDDWNGKQSQLSVYDMTGRVVTSKTKMEWNKGTLQQIGFEQPNGIYIVEIKGENKRFVGKINIIH